MGQRQLCTAILTVCCIAIVSVRAEAFVTKGGAICSESWGPGTVFVTETVNLDQHNAQLTILPGTVVKFAPGTTILAGVYAGGWQAVGTQAQPIMLTSANDDSVGETVPGSTGNPQPGDWARTFWRRGATLEWCHVRFGTTLYHFQDNINWFRHCEIDHMSGDAIGSQFAMGEANVESCHIHDCGGAATSGCGTVRDSEIWNCGGGINGDVREHPAAVERNQIRNCGNGVSLGYCWRPSQPTLIQDNVVTDCTGTGIYYGSYWSDAQREGCLVKGNEVRRCGGDGIGNTDATGAVAPVRDNVVSDCGGNGIVGTTVTGNTVQNCRGYGISNPDSNCAGGLIERNTVSGCTGGITFYQHSVPPNTATEIRSNVISECGTGMYYGTPYYDGSTLAILVSANDVHKCTGDGIKANDIRGRSNVVENNQVSDCGGVGIVGTVVIGNCVRNCGSYGINAMWGADTREISRNIVTGCGSGIRSFNDGSRDPSNPALVENNLVTHTQGRGIWLDDSYGDAPYYLVRNNTIVDNADYGLAVRLHPQNRLYGNLVAFNAGVGIISGSVGDYNLSFGNAGGNTGDYYSPGAHDFSADPLFVGRAAGNYHLQYTSPAIDAGGPQGAASDLEGEHRPLGVAFDAGCYEDEGIPPNRPPLASAGANKTIEGGANGATVSLDASGSSDPDGDSLLYTWQDAGTVVAGPTSQAVVQVTLAVGQHPLTLTVDDGHGGTASDTTTVTVVAAGPTTTLELAGEHGLNDWFVSDVTVALTAADLPETGYSGVASIHYLLDGVEQVVPVSPPARTAGNSFVITAEGSHELEAWAVDAAGNVGPHATVHPRIDRTAPTTTIAHSDTTVQLDAADATVTWYRINGGEWQQTAPGSAVTLPGDGDYEVEAYSVDAAGNEGPRVTVVIQIDKTAPQTLIVPARPPDEDGKYTDPVTVSLQATDAVSGVEWTHYSLDGGATWLPYADPIALNESRAYTIRAYSRDRAGNEETPPVQLVVLVDLNEPPTVQAGGPYAVDEGGTVSLTATGSDPDGDTLTYAWDLDSDGTFEANGATVSFSAANLDGPATVVVKARVADPRGLSAVSDATIEVTNVAPTVGGIVGPVEPVQSGTAVEASATFADAVSADTHTAVWDWGDGQTSAGEVDEAAHVVAGSHTYAAAGVYTVTLTVGDDDGGSATAEFRYVVIYSPDGGFVTGGGWIMSPTGAYSTDPLLTGKATFGFNSKYQPGANVPTGQTQFQFKVAGLDFHSTAYEWLVVAGARAQYKGSGTINGAGDYGFLLTAIDGEVSGGGGVDRFRLKIWARDGGGVVYDNKQGEADDSSAATELGGGSIVIHKDGSKSSVRVALVTSASAAQTAAGAQIVFTLSAEAKVAVEVVNIAGRPLKLLAADRAASAGANTVLWDGRSAAGTKVSCGRYLVRITARTADGHESGTMTSLMIAR